MAGVYCILASSLIPLYVFIFQSKCHKSQRGLFLLPQAEEIRLKAVIKENENLKKEQFKRSQKLFEHRSHERELISSISGGQGQNKNLSVRISHLDEQVIRQQELLYNVEFQLQQMERKVGSSSFEHAYYIHILCNFL